MYDWHIHRLTEWETRALEFTPAQYRALLDVEKLEVRVARTKVAINAAVDNLHAVLAKLPWPPHEVQLWDKRNTEYVVDSELPEVDLDEHPEYHKYFDATIKHDTLCRTLKYLTVKIERTYERIQRGVKTKSAKRRI